MSGISIHPTNLSLSLPNHHVNKCNMTCLNRGVCTLGKGVYGFNIAIQEEDPNPIAEQSRLFDMYCDCPTGYTGFFCEIKMIMCLNGPTQKCSNGVNCKSEYDDNGNTYYHCGCDAKHSNLTMSYAAQFCQQSSKPVFCAAGNGFCKNGGTCLEPTTSTLSTSSSSAAAASSSSSSSSSQSGSNVQVQSPAGMAGLQCKCPLGWEGPHCEFTAGTMSGGNNDGNGFDPSPAGISGLVLAGFTGLVFLVLGGWGLYRLHKYRAIPPSVQKASSSSSSSSSSLALEANGSDTMIMTPPAFLSPPPPTKQHLKDIHALGDDSMRKSTTKVSDIV